MTKLYCYVDESGQDTQGQLFVVSVIVSRQERDELITLLKQIEVDSGKNKLKRVEAKPALRLAYIEMILQQPIFRERMYYGLFYESTDYTALTIETTAGAILQSLLPDEKYKVVVYVDGLRKNE